MVQNIGFHSVAQQGLPLQQVAIFFIRLRINVKFNESILMYGNHVIETEQAISSTIKLHNMLSRFDFFMIRFRRFHGHKIIKPGKTENDANLGTPIPFVTLHLGVPALQKANVMIADLIDVQSLHVQPLFLSMENGETGMAYLAIFRAQLTAWALRFFRFQFTAWTLRFFGSQLTVWALRLDWR